MPNYFKPNYKAQTLGEEPLGNIFDLLTPEERLQYAKGFQPTQTEQAVSGFKGLADVIGGAFNNRNPTYQKDYDSKIKGRMDQDMQFVGNELTRKYAERQAKAAAEKAGRENLGVSEELGQVFDPQYFDNPDVSSENKFKIGQFLNQQKLMKMRPAPLGRQPDPYFHHKQATHLGDKLDSSGMIPVGESIKNIENLLKPYAKKNKDEKLSLMEGKNIPGFGEIESLPRPGFTRSKEARVLRQEAANLRNKVLNAVGGKNLTSNEVMYALDAIGTGAFKTEEELINGLNIIKDAYKADMGNFAKSVTPEAKNLYESRSGAFYSYPDEQPVSEMSDDDVLKGLLSGD